MNTTMNTRTTPRFAGLSLGLALLLTAPSWADHSYSFPRVIEGASPTVITTAGERETVDANMPILVGDRLWIPYNTRLEIVLSDRSLLRVEGDAEIDFQAVAYSSDTRDRSTELHLREGEVQLIVPEDVLGETLPVIATPDATIYVHDPGTFRVTVSREGWTELVVRDGRAEITGERDSSLVYAGDMAVAEGGSRPYFGVRLAGSRDSLERWGERLTREASYADVPYVDRSLRYVAAPLGHHGGWVTIGGRSAWRPRVTVSWRPYSHGYWRHTPAGLTWVSYDSWGYVTHHYGSWDYVPGYGWVWYPGRQYRTAWVHWYWGPDYVGWCPSGYYRSYYGGHGYGHDSGLSVGFGIYGYAGGSWRHFEHWSFTASVDFGNRRQHDHVYSGKAMEKLVSAAELKKGIITTDPGVRGRKDPKEVLTLLEGDVRDYRRTTGRDLPDVSDYVARKPLTRDLKEVISKPKPPAREKPTIVSTRPDRPSTSRDIPRVTRDPKAPMPRVDSRTGREPTVVKPPTKPARVDDDRDVIRVKPRTIDSDDVRRTPTVRTPPRTPTVRTPRSDDEERSPRVTPRDVERYEKPRAVTPRTERKPVTVKPRDTSRSETPRVTSPTTSSKPTVRVTPRDTSRSETPRVTSPTTRSKPSVRESPPPSKPKPTVKSDDRDESSSSSKKTAKSKTVSKKKKKDN